MTSPTVVDGRRWFSRDFSGFSLFVGLCFAGSLTSLGCDWGPGGGTGEGPGRRTQNLALSPEQEFELGRQAYQEILSKSQVVRSGPDVERVRRVGQRIAAAAEIESLQREINLRVKGYRFAWEFNVLNDRQVNAFCLPGGKVGVFTGMLRVVQNDDQLATVMSHEVAHALAHHGSERIARQQRRQLALIAAKGALGALEGRDQETLIGLLSTGTGFSSLAYDRFQESEADHIGIFLMTFAGYAPEQSVAFWQRMREASSRQAQPPEILSTHPSDTKRIAQLQNWLPYARGAKKAYDEGRIVPPSKR